MYLRLGRLSSFRLGGLGNFRLGRLLYAAKKEEKRDKTLIRFVSVKIAFVKNSSVLELG